VHRESDTVEWSAGVRRETELCESGNQKSPRSQEESLRGGISGTVAIDTDCPGAHLSVQVIPVPSYIEEDILLGRKVDPAWRAEAVSRWEPNFYFAGLHSAEYYVAFCVDGEIVAGKTVMVRDDVVDVLLKDALPEDARLVFSVVTQGGDPVHRLMFRSTCSFVSDILKEATSEVVSRDGLFSIRMRPEVLRFYEGKLSGHCVLSLRHEEHGVAEVTLQPGGERHFRLMLGPPGSTVRLEVEFDGTGIVDCHEFVHVDLHSEEIGGALLRRATCGENGRVVLGGIRPGRYRAVTWIEVPGFLERVTLFRETVDLWSDVESVSYNFPEFCRLDVELSDGLDREVWLRRAGARRLNSRTSVVSRDGVAIFPVVPEGQYVVEAGETRATVVLSERQHVVGLEIPEVQLSNGVVESLRKVGYIRER